MSEFKKGDRVLVEAEVHREYASGRCTYKMEDTSEPQAPKFCTGPVQPDPGVPVADLLEEIDLLWEMVQSTSGQWHVDKANRVGQLQVARACHKDALRTAREAAQEPSFKEGEEVWVRAKVVAQCDCNDGSRDPPCDWIDLIVPPRTDQKRRVKVRPDDIRKDDE